MKRLFHLTSPEAWQAFLSDPLTAGLAPASLESEGFVHLSFAEQLAGTLDAHFADTHELVLAELDPTVLRELVGDLLREEPSRAGALFPHVYAPLPRAAFLGAWTLRNAGEWQTPRLAEVAAKDEPAATPFPPARS